uniref:Uncharacterized protein n=1 Tax=Ciona savignyi TaxID=51511 RepID=H2YTB0_CIOSA
MNKSLILLLAIALLLVIESADSWLVARRRAPVNAYGRRRVDRRRRGTGRRRRWNWLWKDESKITAEILEDEMNSADKASEDKIVADKISADNDAKMAA